MHKKKQEKHNPYQYIGQYPITGWRAKTERWLRRRNLPKLANVFAWLDELSLGR
jgi:hypothetical protein